MISPMNQTQTNIEIAAAYGSTKWLKEFIQTYLPKLADDTLSAEVFAQQLEAQFESRGLTSPAQQKNYRSNVCQAIKVFSPNHPAIALISPTTQEYRLLNDQQRDKLAERQTKYISSTTASTLVERATSLLASSEWSEVGAGIAVLIGRRISEILLSEFSLCSPWSLYFRYLAKKTTAQQLTLEIPTLAPADVVLAAIHKLQASLQIEFLKSELTPKMAKQMVNQRFSSAIADRCVQHFSDLVPTRTDRDNLYTHIFRSVYATIAAHWFCPPHVPEHLFKAEIQGHFTLAADGSKLPNYSARANYDDYAIGTVDGNRDGRLGIMFGTLPDLRVIQVFSQEIPMINLDNDQDDVNPSLPSTQLELPDNPSSLESDIDEEVIHKIIKFMAKRGIVGSRSHVFSLLLSQLADMEAHQPPQNLIAQEISFNTSWFINEIESLRHKVARLEQELADRPASNTSTDDPDEVLRLRAENSRLQAQLIQTQDRLNTIQQVLTGNPNSSSELPKPPTPDVPHDTQLQPATPDVPHVTQLQPADKSTNDDVAITPRRRHRESTHDKINLIIDALITWNTTQQSSQLRLRISYPPIKSIASAMGASYQAVIQDVLKQRSQEIDQLHSQLALGIRHNVSVSDKTHILQHIARDLLHLPNWHLVHYD